MITKIIIALLALSLIACNPAYLKDNHEPIVVQNCRQLINMTEQTIKDAGVTDTQNARIANFPYLRVNRFLSSFRAEVQNQTFDSWLDLLQALGLQDWSIELNNLPSQYSWKLEQLTTDFFPAMASIHSKLTYCSNTLMRFELSQDFKREELKRSAIVPSEYNTWQQVLGLYPLTAIPFRIGIYRWHQQAMTTFSGPILSLPVEGQVVLYTPADSTIKLSQEQVAEILQSSAKNPLHIPMPTEHQQQQLFKQFAPHFEIDTASENDKIGAPQWDNNDNILINTTKPVVFQLISHTRMQSKTLLQLNYNIWFPARPKEWPLDLLGGRLDGIIWRVTLNTDGNPLILDSIHNCGCYHFFFPTQYARLSESISLFQEPAFAPQNQFNFNLDQPVIVRLGSNQHYIQKIHSTPTTDTVNRNYVTVNADQLRSLAYINEHDRSLYNEAGIINGSERGERFFFWPMGIPNPGAMRQWGHHATAFVGRRHFDDADLFENILVPITPPDSDH
ncbi:hypothetical protein AU255_10375 [Methyloprofundus sedimenti]|uniref:Uncharacterized protein n=1 Tax=Methyloprofundus sedimenti TaxID=1420851 RepID=A0A1V8M9C0_9GAMM|nr:hypothetical protein [Methyloprofundus sedimenti]OQK18214.1 hypothetical protein AU255_10375 [Methyloprofundus sedimenti]